MGYESKFLLAIEPTGVQLYEDARYVQVVATVDVSKAGRNAVANLISDSVKAERVRVETGGTRYGAYVRSDDRMDREDSYGDPLAPVDLDGLISALLADDVEYRRFALALLTLRAWRDLAQMFTSAYERPVVLHFGH